MLENIEGAIKKMDNIDLPGFVFPIILVIGFCLNGSY
jgi:hypothetical protein